MPDPAAPASKASSGRRSSFAAAAVGTYSTSLAVALLSLGNVLVISRALGPVGRGEVAFLLTIATLTHYLATLGLHEAMSNVAGREPARRPALATNGALLSLVQGALAAAIVAGLSALVPAVGGDLDPRLRWLVLASIPVLILGLVLSRLVTADYRFAVVNAARLLTPVATLTFDAILWGLGALSVGAAVVVWVLAQTANTLLLVVYVATRSSGFGRPDLRLARRSLGFGLKTHGGATMMMGNYRLDQWIVGSVAGSRELGLYSIAVAWAEALHFLGQAVGSVQRPDLVRATRERAAALGARAFRAAIVSTLPIAATMFVAAPVLCTGVFGDEFSGSIDDLRVLIPGAFGIVALKMLGSALVAQGRPWLETLAVGSAFIVTVVGTALLVPGWGGLGAAIASTTAYLVCGLVLAFLFSHALDVPLRVLVPRPDDAVLVARTLARLLRLRRPL